jgi:hypothetical protein
MMLDSKGAVEAERLGLGVVFQPVTIAFRAVHIRASALSLRTAEQSEFHGLPP